MLNITKSVITPYTPAQMYALISDIANYKNYLPWCPSSQVLSKQENIVIGRVDIAYTKIKTHFTTKNINTENKRIDINLVDGPFKHLQGHWIFTSLGETGCKVEFKLEYKFSNFILEKLIGAVFEFAIRNIVDSFVKKAQEIYSTPPLVNR
ncbi:MAG: hypothetical protein RLZZ293_826 [Pseudomonadota bacterium]|jgi:ribosome-associated toxin RatA of RatAB toxin-antitoxin module